MKLSLRLAYGDRHSLKIASVMWHTTMTIVSPYDEPIKIWHDVSLEDSNVVICWNGNDHYSGSVYVEKPLVRLRSIDDKIHIQGRRRKIVPVQVKVEPKEEKGNEKVDAKMRMK